MPFPETLPSKDHKTMQTIGAKQAKDRFGDLLRSVQREPISILRNGQPAAVLVSPDDYARMGGTASACAGSWRKSAARRVPTG